MLPEIFFLGVLVSWWLIFLPMPPIPPQQKILSFPAALDFARRAKASGQRLVLANGCFDLLHGGHISYLESARALGDALIVGINSDASERALKGPGRPIIPAEERAELVAGMGAVDAVVIFDEPTCERLLRELRPHIHAKGTDYTEQTVPERETALELGIEIAIAGAPKEAGSRGIIQTVLESANGGS